MAIDDVAKNNALSERFDIGGAVISDLAKLKTLVAYTSADSATPREVGDYSGGYQVPAGRKFVVVAVRAVHIGGTGVYTHIGTGTSDVGFASASAPTGTELTSPSYGALHITTTAQEHVQKDVVMVVPETLYLHVFCSSSEVYWTIYGFEVDATATTI